MTFIERFINASGILILLSNLGFGQQVSFRGLTVDTVEISSSSGHYHFDDAGTTTGIDDEYIVAFDKISSRYRTSYKRIYHKATFKPETEENREKTLQTGTFDKRNALDDLLTSLSISYNKFSIDQLGLSDNEILEAVNEKRIRRIAKLYQQDWLFKRKYSTREKNDLLFRGCRNMDTLKLLLDSFEVDTMAYPMVTDYWDVIKVRIVTAKKSFAFVGKYPNKLKQPWYDKSDTTKFVNPIVNLDVNRYLYTILPSDFNRRETIGINAMIDSYIIWYLRRRGFSTYP